MQPPPRLDLGSPPPKPQSQGAVPPPPPHFPPPPYREEAAAPKPKKTGLARIFPSIVTLGAFGGLAILAWFAYQEGKHPVVEEELPLIKAEDESYKRAPENPGGEEIPHTDKEVYNSFTSDKPLAEAKKAEPIPDAEQPIDRAFLKQFGENGGEGLDSETKQESVEFGQKPAAAPAEADAPLEPKPLPLAKINEALPNTGGVKEAAEAAMIAAKEKVAEAAAEEVKDVPVQKAAQDLADAAEKLVAADAEKTEESALPPITKEVIKKVEAAKKPETEKKAAPTATKVAKGIRVQLGAYRSEAEAKREWKKIQTKHKSLLGRVGMMVQQVDIPNKGTMYRLQAGPLASRDGARNMCKKLVAAGQGCFIAK